jgi:hypothetical protein
MRENIRLENLLSAGKERFGQACHKSIDYFFAKAKHLCILFITLKPISIV